MNNAPIPPQPREVRPVSAHATSPIGAFLLEHYLPAMARSESLHRHGIRVRVSGVILSCAGLVQGLYACDRARGNDDFVAAAALVAGVIFGYLIYACGAYLASCAQHHRTTAVNAIMCSPHLAADEARELLSHLERRVRLR